MIFKGFKYRIYPNAEQGVLINKTIGCCRFVYNWALEQKIKAYENGKQKVSAIDLCYRLAELKKLPEYIWLNEVDSQALQAAVKKVDVAYKNFFREFKDGTIESKKKTYIKSRVSRGLEINQKKLNAIGRPKFKAKHNGGSFQCPNNTRRIDFKNELLTIPKIKNIPIVLSREFFGKIKTVTIERTTTGKYFASILVETNNVCVAAPEIKNAIGIDLGITHFAILSTGEKIDNPKYLRAGLKKLKALGRSASHKEKGSKNQRKAYGKVAKHYEKISNQRLDFLHKVSSRLIRENQTDTICLETLAVKNMVKNHNLAQAITDVSWSKFVEMLEYKGKWYGKNIIKIDKWYASSKTCSDCGNKYDELNLSERIWQCSECNATHDRDINAAKNIKFMGLKQSGPGRSEEPVETFSKEKSMKQEVLP